MADPQSPTLSLRGGVAPLAPHAFFNALATITSWIDGRPREARELLVDLGQVLRHAYRPSPLATLEEELGCVASYLRLQEARFEGRLRARTTDLPDDLRSVIVPALAVVAVTEHVVDGALGEGARDASIDVSALRVSDGAVTLAVRTSVYAPPRRADAGAADPARLGTVAAVLVSQLGRGAALREEPVGRRGRKYILMLPAPVDPWLR